MSCASPSALARTFRFVGTVVFCCSSWIACSTQTDDPTANEEANVGASWTPPRRTPDVLPALPYHEVTQNVGPGPMRDNPGASFTNRIDADQISSEEVDCSTPKTCPGDMVYVCSRQYHMSVCLDRTLLLDPATGNPMGNLNERMCTSKCEAQGKRLPTNNEWLVGCTGTVPSKCLMDPSQSYWPAGRYSVYPDHPCHKGADGQPTLDSACLTWPGFVDLLPPVSPECVSQAGVYACVGTFGQWVPPSPNGRGKFNGGFYGHQGSSVLYTTPGHSREFYHFANGCRCAADPT